MINEYLAHLRQLERSENTIRSYAHDIKCLEIWFKETSGESITSITTPDLKDYKQYLQTTLKMKPKSINRKIACLSSLFDWAESNNIIKHQIKMPALAKEVTPEPRWLEKSEYRRLLRQLDLVNNPRNKAIILLMLNTGLRVSELCGLKWENIKITPRNGELTVKGKGDKYRTIPINKEARDCLLDLGYKSHIGSSEHILVGQRGNLTPRGIQFVLKDVAYQAKIDELSPHVLRHTFCKNLANHGVSIEKIARLAGHSSLESTRGYLEPGKEDLREAVDKLG